jgi:hypothetical protein
MKEYQIKEIIKKIREYAPREEKERGEKRVFYGLKELRGWRFYLKALLNRDYRSIKDYRCMKKKDNK